MNGLQENIMEHSQDLNNLVGGPFCKVGFDKINLNSHDQLKKILLDSGWVPDSYTEKGSPQLTESSYGSIKGELGQLIAKRAVLKHRAGMIFNITKQGELKGWLNQVRSDGRIEAGAITNGTPTGRKMHRGLVNVPKPSDFGLWPSDIQLRELLIADNDKQLMGIDADSLEAMVEAHSCLPYPNGEDYAKSLIGGTLHNDNARMLSVNRDVAKTFKYAVTYGAQPKKLSTTLNCSLKEAERLHNNFWKGNTALRGFINRITKFWETKGKKKFIIGIDGRIIWVRAKHSIPNAYFQSTGSITVKVAMLFMDKWCRQRGLKSQQVMDFHDEYTYEVWPGEEEIIMELAAKSFVKSSEYLKLRVTVTGTPVLGKNWKEIH